MPISATPTHATATVIANTFAELATNDVLGPYRGFINVDYELLFSDLIEALPKTLTVIEGARKHRADGRGHRALPGAPG